MVKTIKKIFKKSPFVRGMVRIIDLGCTLDKDSLFADYFEITESQRSCNEWSAVGNDIRTAIAKYGKELSHVETKTQ